MSKLQTMVELTEKHVPQDSTCVRGRNLTLGSACLYTLGVFLAVGVFCKEYSALGQCLFHFIQQVAKQSRITTFPIYGYRVLSLGKKKKKNPLAPLLTRQFSSQPNLHTSNSQWSPHKNKAGLDEQSDQGSRVSAAATHQAHAGQQEAPWRYKLGSSTGKTAGWARSIILPIMSLDILGRSISLFPVR